MDVKISKTTRDRAIDNLLKDEYFSNFFSEREKVVSLLSDVLPLTEMASEDPRHKNAADDLTRHLVANDDWTAEYLLKQRLKLTSFEDSVFVRFVEFLISPKYQSKIDTINYLVTFFTNQFIGGGIRFVLTGYEDNLPIYQLSAEDGVLKNIPKDVKKNDIKFHLKPISGLPAQAKSHSKPDVFPSFVLTKDNWDDFGSKTLHQLFFHKDASTVSYIGGLKIMKKGEDTTSVPDEFFLLDENYCSVGMGEDFYKKLSEKLGSNFISVLFALRDSAFFPMIYEEFENEAVFKRSLLRDDKVERNARTISYSFAGGNIDDRYKFKFRFRPLFDDKETEIDFPFTSAGDIPKRIIALIGKNGTGKTQLLTSLAKNLSDRNSPFFSPKTPVFGKVLAVSYSVFDTFEIPASDNSFNYRYCGLKDSKGKLLSEADLDQRFFTSIIKIKSKLRVVRLHKVLKNFIHPDIIDLLIVEDNGGTDEYLKVNLENYSDIKKKLSSGQSLLLYIVVEILAELRYDSLILFDEPETHLHPNAITELISAIYELVDQFDSYCIVATHSPIIVQGLTSDSVYVTERDGNLFSIRKIYKESFGENLSNITDEIFGNRDVSNEYKKIINSFIKKGKNYGEIVELLESDEVPLSLNAKIYIRSMFKDSHV